MKMRKGPKPKDMAGIRFSRLAVVEQDAQKPGKWVCLCDCGNRKSILGSTLRAGITRSCGCLSRELASARGKHGASRTNLYKRWQGMIRRCEAPTNHKFYMYGARGVRVCERWHSFEAFVADMGHPPRGHSIDRIDGDGHYEPGNCRWATAREQQDHVRGALLVAYMGETHCVAEWARRFGMHHNTLRGRLRRGMTIDLARRLEEKHADLKEKL